MASPLGLIRTRRLYYTPCASTNGTTTGFAYIDAVTTNGHMMPLCRLRFAGALHAWGFAIYLASRNGYQDSDWARLSRPGGFERVRVRER
jgi:hypothetical protein